MHARIIIIHVHMYPPVAVVPLSLSLAVLYQPVLRWSQLWYRCTQKNTIYNVHVCMTKLALSLSLALSLAHPPPPTPSSLKFSYPLHPSYQRKSSLKLRVQRYAYIYTHVHVDSSHSLSAEIPFLTFFSTVVAMDGGVVCDIPPML